jgi:hypothetical protein
VGGRRGDAAVIGPSCLGTVLPSGNIGHATASTGSLGFPLRAFPEITSAENEILVLRADVLSIRMLGQSCFECSDKLGRAVLRSFAPTAAEEGTGGRGQEREVRRRLTVAPHLEPPTPAAAPNAAAAATEESGKCAVEGLPDCEIGGSYSSGSPPWN